MSEPYSKNPDLDPRVLLARADQCIANLRADLEAERARSWEGWSRVESLGDLVVNAISIGMPDAYAARFDAADERTAHAEASLRRVGKVVGCPRDDWCEVADATEVVFGSLDQRAREAEAQCAAMRAALQAFTGHWHGYEEREDPRGRSILDQARVALDGDAGRDLLTAVRELIGIASTIISSNDLQPWMFEALDEAATKLSYLKKGAA